MKSRLPAVIVLLAVFGTNAYTHRDRGSWKKTLHEKAVYFEKNTKERHNIEGSYPSSVRLIPPDYYAGSQEDAWKQIVETGELPPGWVFDHGATGESNVAHTSSWTGCYLTGQAFRVAYLRKAKGENSPEFREAYDRADEVISSIRILTLISGQPGYLARGVAYGHGVSYEERAGAGTRDLWAQGVGEFSNLRYRGGPSHHNYDHVFRGLGIYYFVAADERQKKAIREIVEDMSNWAHLAHDMVVMYPDGERESTVLIGGWGGLGGTDSPSGGSLMATTGLKIAAEITGNRRVKRLYDEWVDQLGYRDPEKTQSSIMGPARGNYDDTDHLLGDLYLLNLIEQDEELLKFYRKCVKDSWEVHKDDKMAWFNYVYRAVLGEEYGDPDGSLWYLETHPTCRLFQPQMNSIRQDLEFYTEGGRREALNPLPVYQRPFDNEYGWKGSPYRLDGWLSRTVSVVEISPHDPYVQFAADTSGRSYRSLTKGEVWHAMEGLPRVYDFIFSEDYPWMAFAGTEEGVYRTMDGGVTWSRTLNGRIERFRVDPENSHVVYAIGSSGIYKSVDSGEKNMGTAWRSVSGQLPAEDNVTFAVDLDRKPARLLMLARDGLYTKGENEPEWNTPPRVTREHGFGGVDPLGGRPLWLRPDESMENRIFRAVSISIENYTGPFISVSEDGGETWTPILRQLKPVTDWASGAGEKTTVTAKELMTAFMLLKKYPIRDLRVDRNEPKTWYGLLEDGVAVTHDAGETWTVTREGLDIPRVQSIWIPRHSEDVYVGTPAGLYVSRDRTNSWQDTTLILQEDGAIRAEIGGNAYLTAYWMGRYHGFITDEQANERWWEK